MLQQEHQISAHPHTVAAAIAQAAAAISQAGVFLGHGSDCYDDEAALLVSHAGGLELPCLAEHAERVLTRPQAQALSQLVTARIEKRMPAAYLVGHAWFANYRFAVDARVMIPRSPMAELIESGFQPWLAASQPRLLDIGTGSGCIALASAHFLPEAQVDAVDLCDQALALARDNLQQHDLGHRVRLLQSDLFSAVAGQRYHLIVTNPPYVSASEWAALPPEYRHEPVQAFASGEDGLDWPLRILAQAPDYLTSDGVLVMEVGYSAATLSAALPQVPFLWLEFERGGEGVLLLDRSTLEAVRETVLACLAQRGAHVT